MTTVKTTYLVSKQGNRNLVLDDDLATHTSLTSAREEAARATRMTGLPHFVHKLEVETLFSYRPGPAIEERR